MTPAEYAAEEALWKQSADEIRATPESRAAFLRSVHCVSQGDGPRAMPDQETMERMLDEVCDGPPLLLTEDAPRRREPS